MEYLKNLFKNDSYRRTIILLFIVAILFYLRKMLGLFLTTFILTFLMYRMQNFLIFAVKKIGRLHQRVAVVVLYIIMLTVIVYGIYAYAPVMAKQLTSLISDAIDAFEKAPKDNPVVKVLKSYTKESFKNVDLKEYVGKGIDLIVSSVDNIVNLIIAIILSLFFLLEKNRIKTFTAKLEASKASTVYKDTVYLGNIFLNSFGKVIEAQVLISLTNTILSIIVLSFLGFSNYIFGMAIMIFILGLVPVAGVFISLFPLSMIAYSIGGFTHVVYILIFIASLHALETYFLNPKFMSLKTKLPVFYTLLILILSEKIIGLWGFIIGIPIFIFILELLGVDFSNDKLTKKSFKMKRS